MGLTKGSRRAAKGEGKGRWRTPRTSTRLTVETIRRHTPRAVRIRAVQDAWRAAPEGEKTAAAEAAAAGLGMAPRTAHHHVRRLKDGKVPFEGRGKKGPLERGEAWTEYAKAILADPDEVNKSAKHQLGLIRLRMVGDHMPIDTLPCLNAFREFKSLYFDSIQFGQKPYLTTTCMARRQWFADQELLEPEHVWADRIFTDECAIGYMSLGWKGGAVVDKGKGGMRIMVLKDTFLPEAERRKRRIRFGMAPAGPRHKQIKSIGVKIWSAVHPLSGLACDPVRYKGAMSGEKYTAIIKGTEFQKFLQEVKQWRIANAACYDPPLVVAGGQVPFLQDGAGPHTGKEFLANWPINFPDLKLLPHVANSPDLNPIESCWQMLKLRLRQLPVPRDCDDLMTKIMAVWLGHPSCWNPMDWPVLCHWIMRRYHGNLEAVSQSGGGNWYPEGRASAYLEQLPPAVQYDTHECDGQYRP